MSPPIDPSSPVPLYHQIAEAIRDRIRSGELAPGQELEPIRKASETWGVNLHTVRHAYTALAREGLVETKRPHRTRVRARETVAMEPNETFEAFVRRTVETARRVHGIGAGELARAVEALPDQGPASPLVYVVECSLWQCATHCEQLRELYQVEARPWPLDSDAPPADEGTSLSTFFHYSDVRRRWPHHLRQTHFLEIRIDPELEARIDLLRGKRARIRVAVVETDGVTAQSIAADVASVLPEERYRIEALAFDDARSALETVGKKDAILFAPRMWGAMSEEQRQEPRALEARYVFEANGLAELARELGWRPTHSRGARLRESLAT